jgi:hypothetical protein
MLNPDIKYTEDEYGDPLVTVTVGEMKFKWSDNANIDYPEDLCWSRMIADVWWSGFRMGAYAALEKQSEK